MRLWEDENNNHAGSTGRQQLVLQHNPKRQKQCLHESLSQANLRLNDQYTYKELVSSGVKQITRGAPNKILDIHVGCISGHLKSAIKVTINLTQTMWPNLRRGRGLTTAEKIHYSEQAVHRPPKAALDRGPCSGPSWKNHKAQCNSSLPVDDHIMTEHLTKSDCKGFQYVLNTQWNGWVWWQYLTQ